MDLVQISVVAVLRVKWSVAFIVTRLLIGGLGGSWVKKVDGGTGTDVNMICLCSAQLLIEHGLIPHYLWPQPCCVQSWRFWTSFIKSGGHFLASNLHWPQYKAHFAGNPSLSVFESDLRSRPCCHFYTYLIMHSVLPSRLGMHSPIRSCHEPRIATTNQIVTAQPWTTNSSWWAFEDLVPTFNFPWSPCDFHSIRKKESS